MTCHGCKRSGVSGSGVYLGQKVYWQCRDCCSAVPVPLRIRTWEQTQKGKRPALVPRARS